MLYLYPPLKRRLYKNNFENILKKLLTFTMVECYIGKVASSRGGNDL